MPLRRRGGSSGSVGSIPDGSITTRKLANDAVIGDKIADDAIDSEHYVDGSIDAEHIADSQVTAAKIGDNAVTRDKIINNAINTSKITNNAVNTSKIRDNTVTEAKLDISNSPTAGQFLQYKDATDSLTWATPDKSIDDESVTEAKLDVSNDPSDGQFLQYKDDTDQLTWATSIKPAYAVFPIKAGSIISDVGEPATLLSYDPASLTRGTGIDYNNYIGSGYNYASYDLTNFVNGDIQFYASDVLTFTQGGVTGTYTLQTEDVDTDNSNQLNDLTGKHIIPTGGTFSATDPVPIVSDSGSGSGATITSITVDSTGSIINVTWNNRGSGYNAENNIYISKNDSSGTVNANLSNIIINDIIWLKGSGSSDSLISFKIEDIDSTNSNYFLFRVHIEYGDFSSDISTGSISSGSTTIKLSPGAYELTLRPIFDTQGNTRTLAGAIITNETDDTELDNQSYIGYIRGSPERESSLSIHVIDISDTKNISVSMTESFDSTSSARLITDSGTLIIKRIF